LQKKCLHTDKAPQAIGPYSQAVKIGNLLFISGQIPIDPSTGEIVGGGVEAQTKQCMKNIMAILEDAGLSLDNVVKTTIYVKDLNEFAVVNEAYGSFFEKDFPARACVEVARLPKDVEVEIEAVAVE